MTTDIKAAGRCKECDVQGVTVALADQDGKLYKKPVLVIPKGAFKNHGNFAVRLGVEKAIADTIKPNILYHIVIEQGQSRVPEPKWDTDYYWKVLTIEPSLGQPSPAPAQAPAPAQDAPPWPDAEGGSERPKERSEWKQPKGEFRTPEQIIRTYALESATAFAVALIAKGIDVTHSTEVMLVASKYAAFITDGTLPKQPEAKEEPHA